MNQLTPENRQRLDARYELLDLGYRVLRECAGQQRLAILRGDYLAVGRIDLTLMQTSAAISAYWTDIQSILAPPASETQPAPVPSKEILQ